MRLGSDHYAAGDREAVLERRRLLIAAAASAIGCGAQRQPEPAAPAAPPLITRDAERPATPWSELVEEAPPLAYPEVLEAADRKPLERVCAEFAEHYEALRAAYESMPPLCDMRDSRCSEPWERVARGLKRAEAATLPVPRLCGIELRPRHVIRLQNNHVRFLVRLRAVVKEELDRQLATTGPSSASVWREMRTSREVAWPRGSLPCLSCPEELIRFFPEGFAFATGSSSLTSGAYTLSRWAKGMLGRSELVVVRGHADVTEQAPQELSDARAEAVYEVLVRAGIEESRLKVFGFGASMPIATSKTAEGLAENRLAWLESVFA